jgi:hypothetical protein
MSYMDYRDDTNYNINCINDVLNTNNYINWYNHYYNNLIDMFNILINNLRNKNAKYKKDILFDTFCIFIYNNSSKRII